MADTSVAMARLSREFHDSTTLSHHTQIHARLQLEILDAREEIARLKAELRADQDPARMGHIQRQIGHLMTQINAIREKAAEAEAIVRAITSDIQRLDVAKRNLTRTMQTLERWSMLKTAQAHLHSLLPTSRYAEMAQALAAVTQLLEPLRPLATIGEVAAVFRAAETDRKALQEKVNSEMEIFFANDAADPPDRGTVKEACEVIEVLGGDYRKHIIERYIQLELQDYRRIFRSTDEAGQLDNVPRRYAWFRRVLKGHDEAHGGLFPEGWEVARLLVASFAEQTRGDLTNVLLKTPPSVTVLLDALQATLDFEATYARRFGAPFEAVTANMDALNAQHERFTISSAFDAHFGIFVDAQDKAIADTLGPHRGARSRASFEGAAAAAGEDDEGATALVLPSSMELFHVYRAALDKCSQYTTGEPLLRLTRVFAKWLRVYSDDVLLASMKKPEFVVRRSMETTRADLAEIRNACMVLNTAEYCLNTSLQLETLVREKIKPALADQVSFQDERDGFNGAIAQCLSLVMRELEAAVEPSFAAMLRTPWKDLENVSGRSAYIVDLVGSVKEIAAVVGTRVASAKYTRNFSDKCVNLIMGRFTSAIVKSRPLRKIGAEQLLLDISAVKGCLLELPPQESGSHQHKKYVGKVTKATGELETMLKVILAPDEVPEGFVQNYCLLIGDRSFSNFQKILDLKGTLKGDQLQKLLDIFLAVTRTKDDLEDSSFLTKLDMDEKTTASNAITVGGGLFSSGNTTPTLNLGGSKAPDRTETPKAFGDFRKFFRRDTHS